MSISAHKQIPLFFLFTTFCSQAATLNISGTITSTDVAVNHEGSVVGTFDDVTNILNIVVDFQLNTSLNGYTNGVQATIADAVGITTGDPTVAGSVPLTNGAFSFVSFADNAALSTAGSTFPFTGDPHVVSGMFTLSPAEEAALTSGDIFILIPGDDAPGFATLSASAVPEPSAALLSILGLGLGLLARRRRA